MRAKKINFLRTETIKLTTAKFCPTLIISTSELAAIAAVNAESWCIVIIFIPVHDVTNFEINLSFPIKPISSVTKKVRDKNLIP